MFGSLIGWCGGGVNRGGANWGGMFIRGVVAGAVLLIGCIAAVLSTSASDAIAAPEPNPVATRWELRFEPNSLRFAEVTDGDGNLGLYAYLTYDVANFTGSDRLFAPSFDMMSDQGTVRRSGRGVPREVTDELIARLENPLIEDQLQIVSTILQGKENARTGIVIWPVETVEMDNFTVFASGFSGESTTYFTRDRSTRELVRHVLRKTRRLEYSAAGRVDGLLARDIAAETHAWVMR